MPGKIPPSFNLEMQFLLKMCMFKKMKKSHLPLKRLILNGLMKIISNSIVENNTMEFWMLSSFNLIP